jgi:hypothetical protein
MSLLPAVKSKFVNNPTGKCMDADGTYTTDHARMHIYTCNGSNNQKFKLVDGKIVNTASGMCLDNDTRETSVMWLQLFHCNDVDGQKFEMKGDTIVNTPSGKCVDADSHSAPNSRLQLYTCNGSDNQKFSAQDGSLTEEGEETVQLTTGRGFGAGVPQGTYNIINVHSGFLLNENIDSGAGVDNKVQVWSCSSEPCGTLESQWQLKAVADTSNIVTIKNARSLLYLNEKDCCSVRDHARMWSDDSATETRWLINDLGDGTFSIQNLRSQFYLNEDISSGIANGNQVQLWGEALATESRWKLQAISTEHEVSV